MAFARAVGERVTGPACEKKFVDARSAGWALFRSTCRRRGGRSSAVRSARRFRRRRRSRDQARPRGRSPDGARRSDRTCRFGGGRERRVREGRRRRRERRRRRIADDGDSRRDAPALFVIARRRDRRHRQRGPDLRWTCQRSHSEPSDCSETTEHDDSAQHREKRGPARASCVADPWRRRGCVDMRRPHDVHDDGRRRPRHEVELFDEIDRAYLFDIVDVRRVGDARELEHRGRPVEDPTGSQGVLSVRGGSALHRE